MCSLPADCTLQVVHQLDLETQLLNRPFLKLEMVSFEKILIPPRHKKKFKLLSELRSSVTFRKVDEEAKHIERRIFADWMDMEIFFSKILQLY